MGLHGENSDTIAVGNFAYWARVVFLKCEAMHVF